MIGTGGGNLSTVSWGSGSKFLQVEVDVSGGTSYTDMGTTQLMSVPYALFAGNAGGGTTGPTGVSGRTGATGAQQSEINKTMKAQIDAINERLNITSGK